MEVKEMARMGGLATLKKYGRKHFSKMAIAREAKKKLEKQRKIIRKQAEKI